MSEFNLAFDQGVQQRPGASTSVEWYQNSGQYAASTTNYNYSSAPIGGGAAQYGSFEDEAPLLEELGIDIPGILKRTKAILTNRLKSADMEEMDLGGPLLFAFILGAVHLLAGKLHFGVILGWSVVASAAVWFVVNSLAGMDMHENKSLDLYNCCCLLGYCQLPIVVFALVALLIPKGMLCWGLGGLFTLWGATTAARLLVKRSPFLEDHRILILYPCLLMYSAFALLTIY